MFPPSVFDVLRPSTGAAATLTAGLYIGVLCAERVPVNALRLFTLSDPGVSQTVAPLAARVLRCAHRFQVRGVHAGLREAEVVERQPFRYRAEPVLVDDTVGEPGNAVNADLAVPAWAELAGEHPAAPAAALRSLLGLGLPQAPAYAGKLLRAWELPFLCLPPVVQAMRGRFVCVVTFYLVTCRKSDTNERSRTFL